MNKVCLTGRITKDPELRYTQSNIPCVMFTLAVDRGFKDSNGERITDFISCVAWRVQAEFLANYIRKGYLLEIEGQIQTRNYQDQQGQTRYVTEIMVDRIGNLQPKEQPQEPQYQPQQYQQPQQQGYSQPYQQQPRYEQQQIPTNNYYTNRTPDVNEDDMPF